MEEAEKASRAHLSGHDGSDGLESSGAHGAPSGSMQSAHSSSDKLIRANLGTRSFSTNYSSAVPRGYATERGRTKETQAALGAEKLGGDESREVVAGGKLVARA